MAYSNRKYCIITVAEITSLPVDFSQILESSADTVRKSLDETKTFVKYEGSQPSFLSGKTEYTHSEILEILSNNEWRFTLGTLDVSGVSISATNGGTNNDQSVSLSGASSTANPIYAWTVTDSNGDSTSDVVFSASSSATTNITYNAAGTFNVIMTVSDNSNFYATLSSTIQVTVS